MIPVMGNIQTIPESTPPKNRQVKIKKGLTLACQPSFCLFKVYCAYTQFTLASGLPIRQTCGDGLRPPDPAGRNRTAIQRQEPESERYQCA